MDMINNGGIYVGKIISTRDDIASNDNKYTRIKFVCFEGEYNICLFDCARDTDRIMDLRCFTNSDHSNLKESIKDKGIAIALQRQFYEDENGELLYSLIFKGFLDATLRNTEELRYDKQALYYKRIRTKDVFITKDKKIISFERYKEQKLKENPRFKGIDSGKTYTNPKFRD